MICRVPIKEVEKEMLGSATLAARLARFAVSTPQENLQCSARAIVHLSMIDFIAVARAGVDEPVARITREMVLADEGRADASLFGSEVRVPARAAALANGAAGHALDYDDTHFAYVGHPSTVIMPVTLALAQTTGATASALYDAALIGLEGASRVGAWLGRAHYQLGFHSTASAGSFGAAMAASRLLGLNEAQTTHAISLVASRASGLKSQFGTMGKPYHAGMAASNGIEVALLAKAGFISRSSALDGEQGFAETHAGEYNDAAFEGMGETFIFEDVQHKFHACCHGLHACLEALGRIIADGGAVPDQIEMMSVSTNSRFMRVCNIASPTTGLEAKFSFRLVMALAVLGYDTAALDTYTDEICSVPSVVGLRDMVVVNVDDTLAETESVVTVRDKSGVQKTVRYDLNDLLPLAEKQARIAAKSTSLIGDAAAQHLWDNVMAEQTLPIL